MAYSRLPEICLSKAVACSPFCPDTCVQSCLESLLLWLQQTAQPVGSPEGSDASRASTRAVHTPVHAAVNAPNAVLPVTHGPGPSTLLSPKKQKTDTGHAVSVLHRSGRIGADLSVLNRAQLHVVHVLRSKLGPRVMTTHKLEV